MDEWIAKLLENPGLCRMGHGQRAEDANLGLGWLYYALARTLRPTTAVVIGSYRGFVPLILGKALSDNLEKGTVYFIDPSLVDDFWKDAENVQAYFAGYGVQNIRHFLMTTQQFAGSAADRALAQVDLLFVDGYHSEEQARFDYETFQERLTPNGIALFHDSTRFRISKIYGPERAYECRVKVYLDALKQDRRLQVLDLPFFEGITLVRKVAAS